MKQFRILIIALLCTVGNAYSAYEAFTAEELGALQAGTCSPEQNREIVRKAMTLMARLQEVTQHCPLGDDASQDAIDAYLQENLGAEMLELEKYTCALAAGGPAASNAWMAARLARVADREEGENAPVEDDDEQESFLTSMYNALKEIFTNVLYYDAE